MMTNQKSEALSLRLALCFLLLSGAVLANTGTISGRVIDSKTGEALAFANVIVQETELGAATDVNGRFQIINVPPGRYVVEASYTGYNPMRVTDVLVVQGQTVTVNFRLTETVVDVGLQVKVTAQKVELVSRGAVSVERVITDEQFKRLPVTSLAELVGMQAGITQSPSHTFIRGGRFDDVAYLVDGVAAQDAVYGTLWSSPRPTTDALQSVVVITGGFDAEYGEAMSGIIRAVTREGGPRTSGRVRYQGDGFFPTPALNYGYHRVNLSLGGPTPVYSRLRYFVSGEYYRTDDASNVRYNTGLAPRGEYALEGKLTLQLPKEFPLTYEGLKLTADAHHSNYQWRSYSHTYRFHLDGLYANRVTSTKGNLTINHLLSPTTVYEAKVGYFSTGLMRAVRNFKAEADDTTGFWGFMRNSGIFPRFIFRGEDWVFNWEKYAAHDRAMGVPEERIAKDQKEAVLNLYRSYWLDRDDNQVYAHPGEHNFRTAYALTQYPYGVPGLFVTEGDNRSWHYRGTDQVLGKFDFTRTIDKVHEVKTGLH
ncbi:MAG TPA: TonB-dependent receptor, partial [candidate division WOR-3 bacterium]|nr:TonB-dependent receptor [candidate division WOR-3 bacterium]